MSVVVTAWAWSAYCSPHEKLLFLAITDHRMHMSDVISRNTPNSRFLRGRTGLTDDEMNRAFSGLVERGYFEVTENGDYRLVDLSEGNYRRRVAFHPRVKSTRIYLMKNRRNGYTKIGESSTPCLREKTLQSEEPEVELIHHWVGSVQMEAYLHKEFSHKRVRGEWFNLDEDDIADIAFLMTDGKEGRSRKPIP